MTEESLVAMWSASMASWFTPTSLFVFLNLMIGTIALSSRFTSQKNPNQQPREYNPTQQLFRASSLLQRVKSINFSLNRSESSEAVTILQQHSEISKVQTRFQNPDHDPTHQLATAPSILQRVKSFNFSFNRYENSEATNETQNPNMDSDSDSDSDQYTDNPAVMAELKAYREPAGMQKSVSGTNPNPGYTPAKIQKSVSETMPKCGETPAKITRSVSEKLKVWRAEQEENVERRRPATVKEEKTNIRGGDSGTMSSGDDHDECVDDKADDFINKFRQQLKLQRLDSLLRYKEMITRGSSR